MPAQLQDRRPRSSQRLASLWPFCLVTRVAEQRAQDAHRVIDRMGARGDDVQSRDNLRV